MAEKEHDDGEYEDDRQAAVLVLLFGSLLDGLLVA
jgi:hypothetical protein